MTHSELVQRAGRWLEGTLACPIVFTELVANAASEIPDAIGWRDSGRLSFLVECKASRGDFLADAQKPVRAEGTKAMGNYRYYMCPPGMIRLEEVPARWGLLYVHASKIEVVAGRHPHQNALGAGQHFYHHSDRASEMAMLTSAMQRLRIDLGAALFRQRVHKPWVERKDCTRRFVLLDD